MIKKVVILIIFCSLIFACKVQAAEADDAEFVYLTKCVQAEAGIEDFKGKRLVAAVILNRVEDNRFPDTIIKVINQPKQFSVVRNNTINKAVVEQETVDACRLELTNRSDKEVLYFNNTQKVGGKFCYKYGKHWFGK